MNTIESKRVSQWGFIELVCETYTYFSIIEYLPV